MDLVIRNGLHYEKFTDELFTGKVVGFEKEVESIVLDPFLETADTDLNNNSWPAVYHPTTFELFYEKSRWQEMKRNNPMKQKKKK